LTKFNVRAETQAPGGQLQSALGGEPAIPPWVRQMACGCWYRVAGDRPDLGLPATPPGTRYLADNDPAEDPRIESARTLKETLRRLAGRRRRPPWHGTVGFTAITEAWNGAVYASRLGASGAMVIFGGGHDDYFGSDVHAFDLATRRWSRISDGYVGGRADEYGAGALYPDAVYPDGSPLPPHTYGYVQYDAASNDFLLLKGQLELGPGVKAAPIPHMFNLDALKWRRGPRHPSAVLASGGCTAWDPSRRLLWGHCGEDGDAFLAFAPDGQNAEGTFGTWRECYPRKIPAAAAPYAMAFDCARDMIVVAASAFDRLYAIDAAVPARAIAPLESAGDRPAIAPYAAIECAPNLDRLIYYSATGGAQIYAIAAPEGPTWAQHVGGAWTWRSITAQDNSLDPAADAQAVSSRVINPGHTLGRFRVASFGTTDVAVLVRHVDTPVYAMRLT